MKGAVKGAGRAATKEATTSTAGRAGAAGSAAVAAKIVGLAAANSAGQASTKGPGAAKAAGEKGDKDKEAVMLAARSAKDVVEEAAADQPAEGGEAEMAAAVPKDCPRTFWMDSRLETLSLWQRASAMRNLWFLF